MLSSVLRGPQPRGPQCSHFYSRRYLRTRFDLRNCNAMCPACNGRHNEDPSEYLRFMNERYGPEVVAEVDRLRSGGHKVTDEELRQAFERLRTHA
jgi:hypothetical protein